MTETTIPHTWSMAALCNLGEWCGGGTPSKLIDDYWNGNIPWVSPKDMKQDSIFDSEDHITERAVANSATKLIPRDSILCVTRSGILAHTFPVAISMVPVTVNQDIKTLTPFEGIDARYLAWALRAQEREILETCSKDGTTVNSIESARLYAYRVPVAPQKEQLKIVAKIEKLFSELDNGIESLKAARGQLKLYRHAVLKQAFEGKLTTKWRNDNRSTIESPSEILSGVERDSEARYQAQFEERKVATNRRAGDSLSAKKTKTPDRPKRVALIRERADKPLPELPIGWSWMPFSCLLTTERKAMTTGPFGTMLQKSEHQSAGVPVLGIENIGEAKFLHGNRIFVTPKKADELHAFEAKAGDIVISRSGTVGEICEVPDGLGRALISTNLLRVSLNPTVVRSRFFVFLFQGCNAVKNQVNDLCKGSSRDFLNQSILTAITFPLPSLAEQDEVLRQIDTEMSRIERLSEEIETNLVKTTPLRQSILKMAFSGQLVAQDVNDEPAAVLLKRIQAEKVATDNGKKKNKKREAA
jgi:type I restriction enzyme S subunit